MKKQSLLNIVLGLGILALAVRLSMAEDLTGRFGIGGIFEAVGPVGQRSVQQQADDAGPGLGGWLRYGLSKHLGAAVSYENIHMGNGIRVEPVVLQGIYSLMPDSRVTPTILLGGGFSRGIDQKEFQAGVGKAGLGLEFFPTRNLAIGPEVSYHYIYDTELPRRHLNAIGGGINATLFFGGEKEAAPAPAAAAPVEAAPVAAVVAAIAITASPAMLTMGPGTSQTCSAIVRNTTNQAVTWTINPPIGSVDANGVYTAPPEIAFAEDVTLTATSVADTTKSASCVVHLTPPAAAPQKVSIKLNVLFDTSKSVVKPQYDPEISKVAEFMKSYPGTTAEIEGHTDSSGSSDLNMKLSQERADSVRLEIISKFGIDGSRLTAKGYGETQPIADNKTAAGRAQNRRVVATLTATK